MAARDKEFEWRMQGMVYACKMAKEQGLEFLENDIKKRGILKADIVYKPEDYENFWHQLSNNIYTNMIVSVLWCLYDQYGFRKERLIKFKKKYDEAVVRTLDLNYLGEHFVKLEDYAVELNRMYNMGLNVELAAFCQDEFDKANPQYRDTRFLNGIINSLRAHNFHDAANFLEKQKAEVDN